MVDEQKKKQCTKCKEFKLLDDFYKSVTYSDGRVSWCKVCKRKVTREAEAEKRGTDVIGSVLRGEIDGLFF